MIRALFALVLALLVATPAYADSFDDRVLTLTNAERAKQGLAPLALSPELSASARAYAAQMAAGDFISHTGSDGSTFISRNEAAGYRGWTAIAENVAAGQRSPEQVVAAWMNSAGHRANILSSKFREIGLGHAERGGTRYGHYWAQEFGARQHTPNYASQSVSPAGANGCAFQLGFQAIARQIPGVVGGCLENEHHNPANGDGLQRTTGGLLVWRKADNFTAFTDGHRSWVNGPYGLQSRLNTERFAWEAA